MKTALQRASKTDRIVLQGSETDTLVFRGRETDRLVFRSSETDMLLLQGRVKFVIFVPGLTWRWLPAKAHVLYDT